MPTGVVTPVVPVANDIVLGEYNLYYNYETPLQTLIGASRGGLKLDFKRVIKDIKYDGQYAMTKGLRRYEMFQPVLTVEQLALKYYNAKLISDCESTGTWESQDWDLTGGVYAAETTIVNIGNQSAKATLTNSSDGIHEVFASSKDLTVFDNGEASGTADYIGFAIYITTAELADLGTAKIRIGIHNDAENTMTNYQYYEVAPSALTANKWNKFTIAKSAFTVVGAGAWTGVTGVAVTLSGAPSAETVFYVDSFYLLQNTTKSSIVPVNGGGFSFTDEGAYKKYIPSIAIEDEEYIPNIAIVGKKLDNKDYIVILYNCLNDGNIQHAFKEKDEIVTGSQFTAHYNPSSPLDTPCRIRDYK